MTNHEQAFVLGTCVTFLTLYAISNLLPPPKNPEQWQLTKTTINGKPATILPASPQRSLETTFTFEDDDTYNRFTKLYADLESDNRTNLNAHNRQRFSDYEAWQILRQIDTDNHPFAISKTEIAEATQRYTLNKKAFTLDILTNG